MFRIVKKDGSEESEFIKGELTVETRGSERFWMERRREEMEKRKMTKRSERRKIRGRRGGG